MAVALNRADEHGPDSKSRYKFPYGDFRKVHRCGVISAESRAGQYKYVDVEAAAKQLLERIDRRVEEEVAGGPGKRQSAGGG